MAGVRTAGIRPGSPFTAPVTSCRASRYAFGRDRRKDAALKALGIDPNRVSRDLVKDRLLTVLAYVAAALARAPRQAATC